MPSDTRYARAAMARRSPNARLYSAVPRSSQWPSIVMVQVPYFFSSPASWSSALCAAGLRSLLSSSKNTGWSGEFRFKSSSDADEIASSRTGSGGTMAGSVTGSGGAGGRPGVEGAVVAGGGGVGRATGGVFLPHAAAITLANASHSTIRRTVIVASPIAGARRASTGRASRSPRPVGLLVVAGFRDLLQPFSVLRDREDLRLAGARRHERQMAAVGRERGALVGPFAEGELRDVAGRQIEHFNVVPRSGLRCVRD